MADGDLTKGHLCYVHAKITSTSAELLAIKSLIIVSDKLEIKVDTKQAQ